MLSESTTSTLPPRDLRLLPHPDFSNYHVGEDGSVWSCRTFGGTRPSRPLRTIWHRLKPCKTTAGYHVATIGDHPYHVHTLVLEAFVGPRPRGMVCRHLDGTRSNDTPGNLRWGTYSENNGPDRVRHDTIGWGERNAAAKLNAAQVVEIRTAYATGRVTLKKLAAQYGVAFGTIWLIVTGRKWRHLLPVEATP